MRTKKLAVQETGDGECEFAVSGTPIEIIALWAALTDYVVRIVGEPLCELIKVTDSYDKENRTEQEKFSKGDG